MGLLTTVLTLPVSGPVKGSWWVMQQVIAVAEDEVYNERRIVGQLAALSAQLDGGEISQAEHAEAESALLGRLVEARARSAASQETT